MTTILKPFHVPFRFVFGLQKVKVIQKKTSISFLFPKNRRHLSTMDTGGHIESHARQIFQSGVDSVFPRKMVYKKLTFSKDSNTLVIEGTEFKLKKNLYVVGFGKAVSGMAGAVDDLLRDHIVTGIISIPYGSTEQLVQAGRQDLCVKTDSKIRVYEGARNNLPDEAAQATAAMIHDLVKSLGEDDILMVLVSGGGSALLPMPCPPITLQEEQLVTKLLTYRGATIQELNTVRSNIEVLKGGGLARESYPARVIALILSDVIGDPLDFIASGPTHLGVRNPNKCLELFNSVRLTDELIPKSVLQHLNDKLKTVVESETESANMSRVHNFIVGNNDIATSAAATTAKTLGYLPLVLSTTLEGDTREVGDMFGELANFILMTFRRSSKENNPLLDASKNKLIKEGISKDKLNEVIDVVEKCKTLKKNICIIAGGETTTAVEGNGVGGRNQEMALVTADRLASLDNSSGTQTCFLSAGTDGLDGPTNAAGAVVDMNFTPAAIELGLYVNDFLDNNDSYSLLRKVAGGAHHVMLGHTGTNVMDIQILIVQP